MLRVGLFGLLGWLSLLALGLAMSPFAGMFVLSTLSTFGAAAIANAVTVRIFERGTLSDLGLGWSPFARNEFFQGAGLGIAAALLVVGAPRSYFRSRTSSRSLPAVDHPLPAFLFVSVLLLFGALGEEMLFHGYAFQLA